MQNPWLHDQVPDDGGVRQSRPIVIIAGVACWIVSFVATGVFVFTNIGGEQATAIMTQVLQLMTITVGICLVGWIVQRALRRFRLLSGTLANIFNVLFVLTLPLLVGVIAHQMGFLEGGLTNELSKAVSLDQFRARATERAIGPIEDVLPWS